MIRELGGFKASPRTGIENKRKYSAHSAQSSHSRTIEKPPAPLCPLSSVSQPRHKAPVSMHKTVKTVVPEIPGVGLSGRQNAMEDEESESTEV